MLPSEIEAMRGEAAQRQYEFAEARGGANAFVREVSQSRSRVLKPLLIGLRRAMVRVIESGEGLAQSTRNLLPHQNRVPTNALRSLLVTATENVEYFDNMIKERERLMGRHRLVRAYWPDSMRSKMEALRDEFRDLRNTLVQGVSAKFSEQIEQYCVAALRQMTIERLDDGSWYASLPGFQGVWANGPAEESAKAELAEVLREWVSLKVADGDGDIPVADSIDLNEAPGARATSADQPL